jgi:hypothetical protein
MNLDSMTMIEVLVMMAAQCGNLAAYCETQPWNETAGGKTLGAADAIYFPPDFVAEMTPLIFAAAPQPPPEIITAVVPLPVSSSLSMWNESSGAAVATSLDATFTPSKNAFAPSSLVYVIRKHCVDSVVTAGVHAIGKQCIGGVVAAGGYANIRKHSVGGVATVGVRVIIRYQRVGAIIYACRKHSVGGVVAAAVCAFGKCCIVINVERFLRYIWHVFLFRVFRCAVYAAI